MTRSTKSTPRRATRRLFAARHTPQHERVLRFERRIRHARPLHHRVLLSPLGILALLVGGVLICGWTFRVVADSYTINAEVAAPPLTEGAVITTPTDGAIFTSSPIDVSGTCPSASYVKLSRNSIFSGVAGCTPSHTFTITTALSQGNNTLQAQDYNVTDSPGPATPSITVAYNPPSPPPTPKPIPTTPSGAAPLALTSDYHYQGFFVGTTVDWNVVLSGGTTPYKIIVDWGDGQSSQFSYNATGTIPISHTYHKAGYFAFKVYVTDKQQASTMLQLAAYIKAQDAIGLLRSASSNSGIGDLWSWLMRGPNAWLLVAWPSYITVLLMAVSFWLGERQMRLQTAHDLAVVRSSRARRRS